MPIDQSHEFQVQLRAIFLAEAEEHLQVISAGLLALESGTADDGPPNVLEESYRAFHSLKGAARAVDFRDVEMICQACEGIMAGMKNKEIAVSPRLFDLLHQAIDLIREAVSEPQAESPLRVTQLIQQLTACKEESVQQREGVPAVQSSEPSPAVAAVDVAASASPSTHTPVPSPPSAPDAHVSQRPVEPKSVEGSPADTAQSPLPKSQMRSASIRIPAERLDRVLLQAEEMLSAKLVEEQHTADLRLLREQIEEGERNWNATLPLLRKIGTLLQATDERTKKEAMQAWGKVHEYLDWQSRHVKSILTDADRLAQQADHESRALSGMVDSLLQDTKKLLMLPCATLLHAMPRMVRDLSRELGKDVSLVLEGTEIELDKRALEKLKDPIIHLLRNSVDHGIESPDERERLHKPRQGTIRISVKQLDSNRIEVTVADDGGGIHPQQVRAAALRAGVLSPETADELDEQAVISLIFQSGVTTSPLITDISGRGLGMAIVRQYVEELGGIISVEATLHVGTTFRLILPVTHSTYRGILIMVGQRKFVMPTTHIERILHVAPEDIRTVENREYFFVDGVPLPLVELSQILALPPHAVQKDGEAARCYALIIGTGNHRVALFVDQVLDEQEVLVKALGPQLLRVRNIAGATVLGSGEVVPILSVRDALASAETAVSTVQGARRQTPAEAAPAQRRILVVEDSITSRTLIKNILESAGYAVTVAVDGLDALNALQAEAFNLVVSDVEMPQMDGFTLTEAIRADQRLAALPVVLVTSLESRAHRERGIDVGADAYIVKSSFDQSNLLETIDLLL